MKDLKSCLCLLALAWVVGMFIPGSALAQDQGLPPCCHVRNNAVINPLLDSVGILSEIYLLETTDDGMSANDSTDSAAAVFNDSTMASSTKIGNSAELPANEASRKPGPKLKSSDTGRPQRSGHASF